MWTQRWYHDNETLLPLELDIMYHMIYLELILMSQNISISLSYLWVSEWRSTTPHWIYGIMHRRWAPYKRLLRLRISQVPPFHFVRFVQTHQHFKWFFNGMVASFWSIFTWAETYTRHWPTHIRYSRANHWVHKSYTTVRQMIIYWIICSSTLLLMVQLAQCYCSDIFAFSASNLTAGALSPSFSSSRSSSHSFCLSCSRSLASHTLYLIHSMNNQRSSHLGFTLSPMKNAGKNPKIYDIKTNFTSWHFWNLSLCQRNQSIFSNSNANSSWQIFFRLLAQAVVSPFVYALAPFALYKSPNNNNNKKTSGCLRNT